MVFSYEDIVFLVECLTYLQNLEMRVLGVNGLPSIGMRAISVERYERKIQRRVQA